VGRGPEPDLRGCGHRRPLEIHERGYHLDSRLRRGASQRDRVRGHQPGQPRRGLGRYRRGKPPKLRRGGSRLVPDHRWRGDLDPPRPREFGADPPDRPRPSGSGRGVGGRPRPGVE
jgi:hypothetical protein